MLNPWTKKIKNILSGATLVVFGIVLTFLFFEIVFRVGGAVYVAIADQRNRIAMAQEGAVRILCLGESTTEIGGPNSYPRQLERILNTQQKKIKFAVINGGIPGGNTSAIADNLSQNIKRYQPQIVVLMMGINDAPVSVVGKDPKAALKLNPFFTLIEKSRLVRLFRGLWTAPKIKTHTVDRLMAGEETINSNPQERALFLYATGMTAKRNYPQALAAYQELINHFEKYGYWPNAWFYRKMGWIYKKTGDSEKYLRTIAIILGLNSEDAWAKDQVTTICHEKDNTIISMLNQCIVNKKDDWPLYQLMASCYIERGQSRDADPYFKKARLLRVEAINPVTHENYRQVLETLNAKNIQTVIVQYAMRPLDELMVMLEDIEPSQRAIIVDNEKIFKQAIATSRYEDYFIDRFAGDFGHGTPKGNYLLAENVAKAILKANSK